MDIEDPKGDVFGVTRGLSTEFPGRVLNSALSESTIVGTSIGRALAGQRPVAFIQFADFLPLAFNQIVSELGSMFWRTNGGWQCPVIVMATCGGYKPGLGPFHAQSFEAIAAHTPGLDVVMPSSASDAAGLLNAAFESGRPTLFLYPKSCLNLPERTTSADVANQFVPLGKSRRQRSRHTPCDEPNASPTSNARSTSNEHSASTARSAHHAERDGYIKDDGYVDAALTLVTWGNTVAQCEQAVRALAEHDIAIELLDLRSLSPWDEDAVLASVERTGRLVVVHEDNHTCGFGAEVIATVAEKATRPITVRRVARPDTFVPCHFASQLEVLPSFQRVLETCAELLDLEVTWERSVDPDTTGTQPIRAIGSGPADETVDVVGLPVQVGDSVTVGQVIAELEATKSVVELASTVSGVVAEVCVTLGQTIPVGEVLLRIHTTTNASELSRPLTREDAGRPRLIRGAGFQPARATNKRTTSGQVENLPHETIGLIDIAGATGSRTITNQELLDRFAHFKLPSTSEEIISKTGIESRPWVDPAKGETVFTLAVAAAQELLDRQCLTIHDVQLVIASTTTPDQITPSLACRVAAALSEDVYCCPSARSSFPTKSGKSAQPPTLPAYDINAACSGYLFALAQAFDFLQHQPTACVLVITSEVLSSLLDFTDEKTAPLFGDAATATLLVGPEWHDAPRRESRRSETENLSSRDREGVVNFNERQTLPHGRGSVDHDLKASHHTLHLHRPILSGRPEDGTQLSVPLCGDGFIQMCGEKIFKEATRAMVETLAAACSQSGLTLADLDQVIPHQANQRILDAVAKRACVSVFSNIRHRGNTSSSTIPLALMDSFSAKQSPQRVGLAAFGGGFTFASCLVVDADSDQTNTKEFDHAH